MNTHPYRAWWAPGIPGMSHARTLAEHPPERLTAPAVPTVAEDIATAVDGIAALLRVLGRTDEGVTGTPARFVRALLEIGSTNTDPATILSTTFGGVDYPSDQMIAVGPIPFVSLCEHHLLPFPGTAWVGYVPDGGRIVGLSKIPRLVDHYAARPQVQERLTTHIADALMHHLNPAGAAVVMRATHGCMAHRGVRKPGASMITSVMRGVFMTDPTTRAEFMALTREAT